MSYHTIQPTTFLQSTAPCLLLIASHHRLLQSIHPAFSISDPPPSNTGSLNSNLKSPDQWMDITQFKGKGFLQILRSIIGTDRGYANARQKEIEEFIYKLA
ncbi:MAG: hypothetical protein IPJ66_05715 [Bacteroidetes bacterium]|nr:hypothetical protein [Bacteroidota bacterium]